MFLPLLYDNGFAYSHYKNSPFNLLSNGCHKGTLLFWYSSTGLLKYYRDVLENLIQLSGDSILDTADLGNYCPN